MSFTLPAGIFTGITPFGSGEAAVGYYKVIITSVDPQEGKPASRKIVLKTDDGHEIWDWFTLPEQGLDKKKNDGRLGGILTILNSLGFSQAEVNNGISHEWMLNRPGFIEYIPNSAQGAKDAEVTWITADVYAARVASGAVPVRKARAATTAPTAGGGGYTAPPGYSPPPATVPGPVGGGYTAPPAVAQQPAAAPAAPPPPPVAAGGGYPPPPPVGR
jgi:hypothetical protein